MTLKFLFTKLLFQLFYLTFQLVDFNLLASFINFWVSYWFYWMICTIVLGNLAATIILLDRSWITIFVMCWRFRFESIQLSSLISLSYEQGTIACCKNFSGMGRFWTRCNFTLFLLKMNVSSYFLKRWHHFCTCWKILALLVFFELLYFSFKNLYF